MSNVPVLRLVSILLLLTAAPLAAQSRGRADSRIQVGISFFDVSGHLGGAFATELVYLPGALAVGASRPVAGVMVASNGTVFGYGGVQLPLALDPRFALTPSLGVGAYHAGSETDLGNVVEFRTGIEAGLELAGHGWLSLFFYHLSNAGLGRRNPGIEVLGVGYALGR